METVLEIVKFACTSFWHFMGTLIILYVLIFFVVNGLIKITCRFFRTINILVRGYPPSHLDADGDSIIKIE